MNTAAAKNKNRRPRNFLRAAALIMLFGALFAARGQTAEASPDAAPNASDNYKIGAGDVLRVTVVKQTLLSTDGVRVGNDGTIRLPMLDASITAACLTESELAAALSEQYRKYLVNPQVYVAVREFNAHPVSFVGAVNSPGRFHLQRPTKLLELLTYVNGPAPNAGKIVQIIRSLDAVRCGSEAPITVFANKQIDRSNEAAQEIISLALAGVLKGDESSNPFIEAGDIIRVPEAENDQAFVVGNVRSAATISLREPVTLSKAIALAGGIAPGANIEKIKISRQQPDSLAKTELIVNLKEINNRRRDDVLLLPNDIVDVPGANGTKRFIKDIFRTVVPIVTRAPVVIP